MRNTAPENRLSSEFYRRASVEVARDLLGKIIVTVRHSQGSRKGPFTQVTSGRIVETEAYGENDPASHSAKGETPRNSVMFGEPGIAYVYFIYGMYEMLNFVTDPKGKAGAVLIRALEPITGIEIMSERRGLSKELELTNGPGKLCQALGVQLSDNGQALQGPALFVYDDAYPICSIGSSGRIGISAAKEKLWRFYIRGNPYVSGPKQMRV